VLLLSHFSELKSRVHLKYRVLFFTMRVPESTVFLKEQTFSLKSIFHSESLRKQFSLRTKLSHEGVENFIDSEMDFLQELACRKNS
jgi:hypothetical protein